MNKYNKCYLLLLTLLFSMKGMSQDFFFLLHDSNSVKQKCYLIVGLDQLQAGVKMSNLNYDSTSISKNKIVPLKSHGLTWDLLFFKFKVNTVNGDTLSYIFCYNQEVGKYYKIGGFQNNDYDEFFSYLKKKGIKLNQSYFKQEKVSVESIDLLCLLDFYRSKLKDVDKKITDADRQHYKCLQHYYGVIIIP
jgi:hypothetical protein